MEPLHMYTGGYIGIQRCRMVPLTNWVTLRRFDEKLKPAQRVVELDAPKALRAWRICNQDMIKNNHGRETNFVNLMSQIFAFDGQGADLEAHFYKDALTDQDRINNFARLPAFRCEGHELDGMKFFITSNLWIQPEPKFKGRWERYVEEKYGQDRFVGDPKGKRDIVSEGQKLSYNFFLRLMEDPTVATPYAILEGLFQNVWVDPMHYFFCAIHCVGEQMKKNTATLDLVAALIHCCNTGFHNVELNRLGLNIATLLSLPLQHNEKSADTLELFTNPSRLHVVNAAACKTSPEYPRHARLAECTKGDNRISFSKNKERFITGFLLEEMCLDEFTNHWISANWMQHFESSEDDDVQSGSNITGMIAASKKGAGKKKLQMVSVPRVCDVHQATFNSNKLGGYVPQSGHGTSFLGNVCFDNIAIASNLSGPVQYKTAHLVYALLKWGFDQNSDVRKLVVEDRLPDALRLWLNSSLKNLNIL